MSTGLGRKLLANDNTLAMVEKHVEAAYDLYADENRFAQRCNTGLKWLKSIDLYGALVGRRTKGAMVRHNPIYVPEVRVLIGQETAGQHDAAAKASIEQRFAIVGHATHRHPDGQVGEARAYTKLP